MTLTTLPWSEIYNALSRGVVDGCWSMWPSLVDERHYEVRSTTPTSTSAGTNKNVAINKEAW
jgi:TRAP-type C4-dicarboxylate transport system substrate-binding protein